MLSDIMLAVVWILGMPLMAGVTEGGNSVGRFFTVILWPLVIMQVLGPWGWEEFKYRMHQRRKRKSQ